ncbi:MAG: hypothetical protein WAM78_03670, partial [Candidatus Sulfotelmatobacter sp.]
GEIPIGIFPALDSRPGISPARGERSSDADAPPSPWSKRRDHASHRHALEPLGGPIPLDELHDIAEESSFS